MARQPISAAADELDGSRYTNEVPIVQSPGPLTLIGASRRCSATIVPAFSPLKATALGWQARIFSTADASADGISHQFDSDFMPGDVIDITESIAAVDNRVYQLHYSGGDGRVVSANLATESTIGADVCVVSGYAVVIG